MTKRSSMRLKAKGEQGAGSREEGGVEGRSVPNTLLSTLNTKPSTAFLRPKPGDRDPGARGPASLQDVL